MGRAFDLRTDEPLRHLRSIVWGLLLGVLLILAAPERAAGQAAAESAMATAKVGAGATKATPPNVRIPTLPMQKDGPSVHLPAGPEERPEVRARRELEARAGDGAATLLLRSVPSDAQVWIHGRYVGKTPMLLILAPGAYPVRLQGNATDPVEKNVDLLPHEKREVEIRLPSRYRNQIRLRPRRTLQPRE